MSNFVIYPAIDLRHGNCVRLLHGNIKNETIYERNPIKQVNIFVENGFNWIHVVDLNAAFGNQDNKAVILEMLAHFGEDINFQLGGGIRSLDNIKFWIDKGIKRLVLGTLVFENPTLINKLDISFHKKLALAMDIKNNKIAIKGWKKLLTVKPLEFLNIIDNKYFDQIIFTDISRDGSLDGVNLKQTEIFAKSSGIPVIASGGISNIKDVTKLSKLRNAGVSGAIIGKAIYERKISLNDLTKISKDT